MKTAFYNTWAERHNIPTLDEKLTAAGVASEPIRPSNFELEHALCDELPQTEAYAAIAQVYRDYQTYDQRHEALATVLAAAIYRNAQDAAIAAMDSEDQVTVENGFTEQQATGAVEISNEAQHNLRRSRAGNPIPRMPIDWSVIGLVPDAYTAKRGEDLEQAKAFFA